MKKKAPKIGKFLLSILLCLIILTDNIVMFIIPAKELSEKTKESAIEVSEEANYKTLDMQEVVNGIKITSRGNMADRVQVTPITYNIYELVINKEKSLYFEDINNLKEKEKYLLYNTRNVTTETNKLEVENYELLNTEGYINKIIQNYIDNYPKIKTCFPTTSHRISSTYGRRASRGDFHTGIDLCGNKGDPIYAYKDGEIIKIQYSNKSYGNMILIKHKDGTQTRYAHLSSIKVDIGQSVKCGELIGEMGSTGNSTGNHLHFEVIINNKPINPYNYIF